MLHVDDDEIVAGEADDMDKSGAEGAEVETVEGFAIVEAGFEGWRTGQGGRVVGGDSGGIYLFIYFAQNIFITLANVFL